MHIWADDLAKLADLDVYGDLLSPFGLRVDLTLADAAAIVRDLFGLNNTVFNMYVSYVLARAGYYDCALVSNDVKGLEDQKHYSDKFRDDDWIKHWELFSRVGGESWTSNFSNHNEKLSLRCVNLQLEGKEDPFKGRKSFIVWPGTSKSMTEEFCKIYKEGGANYFVIHPAISKLDNDSFVETKSELTKSCGKEIFLSTGELRRTMFEDPSSISSGWATVREKLRSNFESAWPVISLSRNNEILRRAAEDLEKASLEYQEANYTHSIRDATFACETLLLALCQSKGKIKPLDVNKTTFDDYLGMLKSEIEEDFGPDTFQDLNMIRIARNRYSHPPAQRPAQMDALRILRKVQLFHEYFQMKKSRDTTRQ